jgi:hypothetical protein
MITRPDRFAAVSEYAREAGIGVDVVLSSLEPFLRAGQVALEATGGELFVHTAPMGRLPGLVVPFPPNRWELLRRVADGATAHQWWRLATAMEQSGWSLTLDGADEHPVAGVPFRATAAGDLVPVLAFPDPGVFTATYGPVDRLVESGARSVIATCPAGQLERAVTAVRLRWASGRRPPQVVIVCEAPRFDPVEVRADDGSMAPVSIEFRRRARGVPPDRSDR